MEQNGFRKFFIASAAFLAIWVLIRYFFPLAAPFLLGWFFAFLAEPMTKILHNRLRLNRTLAAGISVTLVLTFLMGILWFAGALCYRELAHLASGIPSYAQQLGTRISAIRDWALGLVSRVPGGLGDLMRGSLTNLFAGSSVLLEQLASGAISAAGSMAGRIPGGALMIGTAVISGYMISAQYPALKRRLLENDSFRRHWEPWLNGLWDTVRQWLKAQFKLSALTFGLVGAGFLLLRVKHPVIWAVVTALVDAVPVLGTGTVLIPMALFSLLWGEQVRGIGLLALYITAMLTRSALEPRLVGQQLGMNPLYTLMALYVGFRLWGITGMILSPILAVTVQRMVRR